MLSVRSVSCSGTFSSLLGIDVPVVSFASWIDQETRKLAWKHDLWAGWGAPPHTSSLSLVSGIVEGKDYEVFTLASPAPLSTIIDYLQSNTAGDFYTSAHVMRIQGRGSNLK